MKEKLILASCLQSREAWEKIVAHVKKDDFTEQGKIVFDNISDYYDTDPAAHTCEPEILTDSIARSVHAEKHRAMFEKIITELSATECSPPNVVKDFIGARQDAVGQKLASALLSSDKEKVEKLLGEYDELSRTTALEEDEGTKVLQGGSIMSLVSNDFDPSQLIPVLPESLNRRLDGGVKRGHHIVVFARPEMGKTMTVINMMAGFLEHGLRVLYVGNEDPISDIVMRVVSRLTGMTKYEVLDDPEHAEAVAFDAGYNNLILASMAPGTIREITSLMEKYEPDVLVLDQLRNLNMHQDHFVQKLEQAATAARNLAKRYNCVVVSVTQAGDSASGKSVLDLGDVDSSNTGIPAQADVMIGIGATDQHAARNEIVLSLPKNKVSGKHEWFTCITDPTRSYLRSLD